MELTSLQARIKKESRVAFMVAIIIGCSSIAMFGFMLFLVIATAINPGELHPSPETAFEEAVSAAAPFLFNGVFISFISFFAAGIFNEAQTSYTPFSGKNTKRLKAIANTLGIMALTLIIYDFLGINISFGDGESLFSIGLSWSYASAFGLSYLIIGIMFGLLVRIFEYGRLLQQESDEML